MPIMILANSLFPLGQIVATTGVMDAFTAQERAEALQRHSRGDWGDCDSEDAAQNDLSVKEGHRILSAYTFRETRLWVITERDRSATTLLLPSEY